MLSAPLHDQLQVVSVVRRRVFVAGALAMAFAVAARLRRRERSSHGASAGSRTAAERIAAGQLRRAGRRPRLGRARASSRGRSSACACGSRSSTAPAASSSPTPRTSCARRSSRSAGFLELLDDPDLDEATREEFLAPDARAGRAADEARHRPARPLPARRRPADGRAASRSTSPSSPRSWRREFAPGRAGDARARGRPASRRGRAQGDAERVLQIGRILVENALVHTPPGTTVRGLDGASTAAARR